jgi:tRNA(Ile)-lysidine synthase
MIDKVHRTIKKYGMIEKGDKVIVGVSGGPDSVALLHVLWSLKEELGITLHVVHLDHMFRGEESAQDAVFVKELCETLQVPATVVAYNVKKFMEETGMSLQAGARKVRYDLYDRVFKEIGASKIAIGQNLNDQAETVLMRFLRGAGPEGLGGIAPVREGKFIRPLIEVSRREIEQYLQEKQIVPRIDQSNLKDVYLRNKLRLKLLPLLEKEYNANIISRLAQTSHLFREENELMEELAQEKLTEIGKEKEGEVFLDYDKFLLCHRAMQRRLLRKGICIVKGELLNISFEHIEDALRIIGERKVGASLDLPGRIQIEIGYRQIILRAKSRMERKERKDYLYPLPVPGEVIIPETNCRIDVEEMGGDWKKEKFSRLRVAVDAQKVKLPLFVRNRRPGDRFTPKGMTGRKKLKEYFIDRKIPKEKREFIPIICDQEGIIWVAGERTDDRVVPYDETQCVLVLTIHFGMEGD